MSLDDTNTEVPTSPSPSPSPSSKCETVEVTGVLAVTAFSATMDFDPDWSVSKVANNLHSYLSDSAQRLFDLKSPVGLQGLDIFKSASIQIPGGLKKPITEVKADGEEEVAKYLIMFDLPSDHANIVQAYVNDNKENKENLAVALRENLVKEEEVELPVAKKGKKKGKGKKKDNAVKSDTSSQNPTQMYEVLLQRLDESDLKFAKQESVNGELQKTIAGLSNIVARQTQILHALHRRVVLDQARDLIIDRYGFKISDLRLGGHRNQVERQTMLQSLLRTVRSALSLEDSDRLSDDALRMIFDGAKHTIRDAGNMVAHEASTSDISLAVLEGNLTQKQSEALSQIYIFTHNQEPQLK